MPDSRWAALFPDTRKQVPPPAAGIITAFTWSGGGTAFCATNPLTYLNCTVTGGTGTSATFNVTRSGALAPPSTYPVTSVAISNGGTGYTVGDVLTVSSAQIGGSGVNLSITVTAIV